MDFNFCPLIRGQRYGVASERSYQKNDVIFEFFDPKNLFFNIHHGKEIDLNFLYLCIYSGGGGTSPPPPPHLPPPPPPLNVLQT